jgi:predicted ATPase
LWGPADGLTEQLILNSLMPLTSGTKLGRYEIQGPLGTGGMGEVYRALDPRLDRIVAIKILPSEFSADKDRLLRFEREARSASALNHPNIVTIYELGQHESIHFIAMELVGGQTLRDLLNGGVLPMRRAIEIAAQVAEGLAKAHEASIAHRDIKPANLMITQDGFVKILDFGLAKIVQPATDLSNTITKSGSDTQPGVIIGTPEYMSPEQASGLAQDFRSDQFSFGAVLFEMLTGKRLFARSNAAETLVAILRDPIDSISLQTTEAPAPLCWAIERCLAKDPEKRYLATRDLARELAAIRDRITERARGQIEVRANSIPVQRTGFVGREKEVATAREMLLRPDVRLVTVTGPGGIGKTRLGVEVASGLAEFFPGGIHFVPLAAVNDPGLIISAIVQTLGLRITGGQSPAEILRRNFQDVLRAPMLLVLDNFEHLVQGGPTLAEILAMAPNLKILVTSRAALRIYGEHEFPVPPLALPDSHSRPSAESLARCPAVALFVQRAAAAKPGFELNQENASAISEICARLDGLPLAIELAAARVKVLSLSAMRSRLASRLQLLTGGARDLPQRQQTLRGAIDWSYDLLSPAEQTLFRRLSVFVGGCTLEGVEAVCNTKADLELDLLDGMSSMVDKSLLQQLEQPNGESRFTMLETIREYAKEKLEATSEAKLIRRTHAAYYLVLAEEDPATQSGPQQAEWFERLGLENNNLRAALDWLAETRNADWGLRLSAAMFRFWEARELFGEGRNWLDTFLHLESAPPPTKTRARALFSTGVLSVEQRDYPAAEEFLKESMEVSRQLGDAQGVAVGLNALAVVARDRGDLSVAHGLFEKSLAQWQEMGDRAAVARALSNLANVVNLEGDYARARTLYADCGAMFERLRDRTGVAWSLNYSGEVAREQGDYPGSRALYEKSLVIFHELDDRWGMAGTLADLGNLAAEQQDWATAHSLYRESLKIFRELDQKRGMARALECLASVAVIQSEPSRALKLAGTAAALRENIGTPLTPAEQTKLESVLQPARQSLSGTGDVAAWLEGWSSPVEIIIDEALAST